ncbi:amidohydrolase family protein [Nocardia transvalensis]|uniref:amidohydrolase family protein n=1 Tax=Nocardia transvalensis TaxID=37333 RepID=UPI00189554A1|nr:amidohydrolase family protein [Nocardia transvalensis]MBF6331214.1 amidohydrolase family protein [Nocardia transvalensis]
MHALSRADFLRLVGAGAVGAITGGAAASAARADAEAPITVLHGATVIDGTDAPPRPDTTVVLAGDRILAVGRYPDIAVPQAIRTVDLTGKYIVPGLWDMHTHAAPMEAIVPPLHVVHGVTGIREMWGFPQTHDLRRRIEQGQAFGPRMVVASNIVDGPPGIWPGSEVVTGEAQARDAVRRARRDGADFVKVYSLLTRETFTAIADESHRVGIRFAGHVPYRIPAGEAVVAGQYTLEHMYGLLLSTSARAGELYAQIENMSPEAVDPDGFYANRAQLERVAAETHSPEAVADLGDRMIRHGSWLSPTLVVLRSLESGEFPGDRDDERLRYMPASVQSWWRDTVRQTDARPEEVKAALRYNHRATMDLLGALHAAGVGIVAGTDTGVPYVFPGSALHEELELLVRAGLSPLRALQAATRDAARCLGIEHLTGTVEPGKFADLVVLDADPLASITNTSRIHAVLARGRYLGPDDRARIFAEVESAARAEDEAPPEDLLPIHCCG